MAGLRIVGAGLPAESPLPGLWAVEAEMTAFAAETTAPLRWEVELPSGEAADAFLTAQEVRLEGAEQAVEEAALRLRRVATGEELSFAVGDPLATAEAELRATLRRIRGEEAVAFGVLPSWEALSAEWNAFLEGVERLLTARLRVETREAGCEVARTVVGWDGQVRTVLRYPDDEALAVRHRRAVALAMRSQRTTVRLLTVIFGGAAALAVQAAIPGAVWKLLPAVWTYVRQVQAVLEAQS